MSKTESEPASTWHRMLSRVRNIVRTPETNESRRHVILASEEDKRIVQAVRGNTMTNPLRIHALLDAAAYVVERGIPGAFAECGVWRGGSVLAMLLKLKQMGVTDREVYLFDTFEGMTEPTDKDTSAFEPPAPVTWQRARQEGERAWPQFFSTEVYNEQRVRELLMTASYPLERLHFVRGPVEQTLPGSAPESIALLRLDTDWYESTRHELECLYPRISPGGVLIIDDYGHWEGCRQAVDEYFSSGKAAPPLLNRIDYTARIAVKA
jgi:O-methyltransferase